jgi:hypothetical protein
MDEADATTEVVHETGRQRAERERAERAERAEQAWAARVEAARATGCGPCTHAVEVGHWGPLPGQARTHCRDCHRSWASARAAHCAVCCAHFVSAAAFDRHQRHGSCLDPRTAERRDGKALFADRARDGADAVWAIAFYGERPSHWGSGASG